MIADCPLCAVTPFSGVGPYLNRHTLHYQDTQDRLSFPGDRLDAETPCLLHPWGVELEEHVLAAFRLHGFYGLLDLPDFPIYIQDLRTETKISHTSAELTFYVPDPRGRAAWTLEYTDFNPDEAMALWNRAVSQERIRDKS